MFTQKLYVVEHIKIILWFLDGHNYFYLTHFHPLKLQ